MKARDGEAGDWRGLDSPNQSPRYTAVAEMLRRFCPKGSILDVGCGQALLRDWLPTQMDYTGIELSATAVQQALARDASLRVRQMAAEDFDARGERFDCIAFNEILYYTADPVGLLRKYTRMVNDNGVILCSVYQKPERISFKRKLLHLTNPKRPLSNIHCSQMVRKFMNREAWPILDDRVVRIPGTAADWHIWLARPTSRGG